MFLKYKQNFLETLISIGHRRNCRRPLSRLAMANVCQVNSPEMIVETIFTFLRRRQKTNGKGAAELCAT